MMTTQDFARFKKMEQKERFLKESIECIVEQMKKENVRIKDDIQQDEKWIIDPQQYVNCAYKQGKITQLKYQMSMNESRINYFEQTLKLMGDM